MIQWSETGIKVLVIAELNSFDAMFREQVFVPGSNLYLNWIERKQNL